MTQAQLEAQAALLGITGLSAAQLTAAAAGAVQAYSRQRPRILLLTFSAIAGQEEYPPPTSGAVSGHICLDVQPYSDDVLDLWASVLGFVPAYPIQQLGDVIIEFHQPSQVDIYRGQLDAWGRQFGASFVQDSPGQNVRLTPPPAANDTLAWLWTFPYPDASTVPAGDEDLLVEALEFCALGVVATASGLTILASGGRLTLGPYTKDSASLAGIVTAMLNRADAMEKAWVSKAFLGVPGQKA